MDVIKELSIPNLVHHPYFYKRKPFEYEREVRVVVEMTSFILDYLNTHNKESVAIHELSDICEIGTPLQINVETLISENSEVIISPYAEQWVTDTVTSIVEQYGFQFPVNRSRLLEPPGQELKYLQEAYGISDEVMRYWETDYGPGERPKLETEQDWELWRKAQDAFSKLSKKDQYFIMSYWSHPDYL